MSTRNRSETGIEVRVGRNGRKSYRVRVWSNRERKRIVKTFSSLAEAKAWRGDALVALRAGTLRTPDPRTIREAAEAWLDGAREGRVRDRSGRTYKPSTVRTYDEKLTGYVLPALGDYRLSEVRRRDVQDLADELVASGLSPSSVRNTIDPLRAIYRRAIQREQVAINPTSNLDPPSSRRKPVRIATPAEARTLLSALPADQRATWAIAFYAGLRRGELQALRCSAIDLGASTIRVEGSWDQYEGAIDPKSLTSTRTVPLLAILRDYLDEHLLATRRSGDDLAFGRTAGDPFVPSTLTTVADAVWEAAGIERITLHNCRHSFASLLIASGENPKAVQEFMGHSTITMTFDLYGHLFPGSRDEARARMDTYLEAELVEAGPIVDQ
jgi:integrase